ncbi:MAG: GNAT family N-acetyltransferase [Clostridiaceae bacterium]
MNREISFVAEPEKRSAIAREVLLDLPEWFGIPEYTENYIRECAKMPLWACTDSGEIAGFLAIKETSPYAVELHVMGVKKAHHRTGIGKALLETMLAFVKAQGYSFLHVKTVDKGHYQEYDDTRLFYESVGFRKLEVLPELWDPENPCLLMILYLQ